MEETKSLIEGLEGIARVLDKAYIEQWDLDHDRSGDLVTISEANR